MGDIAQVDDTGLEPANENVEDFENNPVCETNGARAALLPNIQAVSICDWETGARSDGHHLQKITRLMELCNQAVATLIDATPREDAYTLETLGPILSDLRTAQSAIERLGGK